MLINYCLSGWLPTGTHKGNVAYDKYKCTYCRLRWSYVDCIITSFAKEMFDANCNYLCKEYRDVEGTFSRSTVLPISLQVAALSVVQQITVVCHSQRRLLCLCSIVKIYPSKLTLLISLYFNKNTRFLTILIIIKEHQMCIICMY